MNNIETLKAERETLRIKASSLKTKVAKEKVYNKIKAINAQLFNLLHAAADTYGDFAIQGIVKSFRSGDDEMLVKTNYGDSIWLSACNDVLSKSWYPSTCCIEYTEGQAVVINCKVEVDLDRACLKLLPLKIEGGRVNEDKYREFCKQPNLAFFKYPQGLSGLFK